MERDAAMERPPVITLTDAAAERVRSLMSKASDPVLGLRIGVKTKGCSGMSYSVEYAKEQKRFEDKVEEKGVTLSIDPTATMFIVCSKMRSDGSLVGQEGVSTCRLRWQPYN